MAPFFQECKDINIHGGNFYDVNGNLTVYRDPVHSRRGSDKRMPSMSSRSPGYREDRTGPPSPQRPQLSPSQNPVTSGTSYAEKTHINGVSNDNSQNYHQSGAPPDNRRQPNGPKWMSGPDQGTIQSTNGPNGRGQSKGPVQVPFQAGNTGGNYDPQAAYPSSHNDYMNTGMANLPPNGHRIPTHLSPPTSTSFSSDPQIGLDQMGSSNPSTNHLSPPGPSTSGPHGRGQFKAPVQAPFQFGNTGGNYDPQAAYSSTHNDYMNTGMANLSLNGPRIPAHPPPTSFSSGPQIGLYQMGSSSPPGPSTSGPHGRGQFKAPVQAPFQAGNTGGNYDTQAAYSSTHNDYMNTGTANLSLNGPRIPAHPPPTFSSDPQIGLDQMGSWNPSTSNLNLPGPDRMEEEPSSDKIDEQIPTAAQSTVDSSGKGKKTKKWPLFKRK